MAEEIAYNISVNTSQAKSLKELKKDFKEAQNELSGLTVGTTEYVKALEKLGAIRDNIGDLNAEINAFNPEGKIKAFGNVVQGLAGGFQVAEIPMSEGFEIIGNGTLQFGVTANAVFTTNAPTWDVLIIGYEY